MHLRTVPVTGRALPLVIGRRQGAVLAAASTAGKATARTDLLREGVQGGCH